MPSLTSILRASLLHFDLVMPVKYTAVASLTWATLDLLETFPAEVVYMWPSQLSAIKILFFVNRYLPFLDMPLATVVALGAKTPRVCSILWPTVVALYIVGSLVSEVILMVRTAAIWGFHRVVVGVMVLNALGIMVPTLATVPSYLKKLSYPPAELAEVTACMPSVSDFDCWVFYACIIVSETTVVVLTLLRQYMTAGINRKSTLPLLLRTTYRDGAGFYTVMLCVSVANMLFMTIAPVEMSSALQLPHRALHSTLCSRVLLNLREAAAQSTTSPSNDFTKHSGIVFAAPEELNSFPLTRLTTEGVTRTEP